MPQLAPRVLNNGTDPVTYDVSTFDGRKTVFVAAATRFAESSTLTEETRPTASKNDGHKVSVTLALPHPVGDQDGCCVNKDAPPVSFLNLNTLASKFATNAQRAEFLALIRSYVNSTAFGALVVGGSNY